MQGSVPAGKLTPGKRAWRRALQTQSARTSYQYRGMWHALASILASDGWRGLYRGLGSSLLGLSHVAVQFPLYEQLKTQLVHFGAAVAPRTLLPPFGRNASDLRRVCSALFPALRAATERQERCAAELSGHPARVVLVQNMRQHLHLPARGSLTRSSRSGRRAGENGGLGRGAGEGSLSKVPTERPKARLSVFSRADVRWKCCCPGAGGANAAAHEHGDRAPAADSHGAHDPDRGGPAGLLPRARDQSAAGRASGRNDVPHLRARPALAAPPAARPATRVTRHALGLPRLIPHRRLIGRFCALVLPSVFFVRVHAANLCI